MLTYSANGYVMRDVTVDDWYYAAIDRAIAEGLMNGVQRNIWRRTTSSPARCL